VPGESQTVTPDRSGTAHDTELAEVGAAFSELVAVMARLRAPGGCPWDAEQTHRSLSVHLIEEAYETLDAIDRQDMDHLKEELGDLLLQVVFHSEIADETESFDVKDVVETLVAKLIQRHPHVFGDVAVAGAAEVVVNWEALKAEQKGRKSLDDGLPPGLPALVHAHKVLRRVSGVGQAHNPSAERLAELCRQLSADVSEQSVGAVLLEVVAMAGAAGVDPEGALRRRAGALMSDAEERRKD
jgi:XTP/dITP diphosphohydrolase